MIYNFKFKGNRNYVHGTDMINYFLVENENVNSLSVQIKKMTSKKLKLTNDKLEGSVIAVFNSKSLNEIYYLVESDIQVQERYEYDENDLVSAAIIHPKSLEISMLINNSFTLIENIVALHKKLVTKVISDRPKWLFVGLELTEIPNLKIMDVIKITIFKKLGTKLIISEINLNQKKIGEIRFSSTN